jgi:hypothetical protein
MEISLFLFEHSPLPVTYSSESQRNHAGSKESRKKQKPVTWKSIHDLHQKSEEISGRMESWLISKEAHSTTTAMITKAHWDGVLAM